MYQIVSTIGLIYALAVDAGPNGNVNVFEDGVANLETPSVLYLEDSSGELSIRGHPQRVGLGPMSTSRDKSRLNRKLLLAEI